MLVEAHFSRTGRALKRCEFDAINFPSSANMKIVAWTNLISSGRSSM